MRTPIRLSIRFTLILLFTLPMYALAQRNAPVVGDAAKLVDLLKKNYALVPIERRKEEIYNDQLQVIAHFQTYLTDSEQVSLKKQLADSSKVDTVGHKKSRESYFKAKNKLESFEQAPKAQNFEGSDEFATQLADRKDTFQKQSNQYFSKLIAFNSKHLTKIKTVLGSENVFLTTVIQAFIDKYNEFDAVGIDHFAEVNHSSSIKKAIPFIGGDLSFEMLMDGLGRFLAQRIKDELTAHVFSKIDEWLSQSNASDPFAELKVILPKTTDFLKSLDASGISSFGEEIKQYIEDDLSHILENASNLKDTPRFKNALINFPDLDFAFEAMEFIPSISKMKSPIEYFEILENSRNITRWKEDTIPLKHNISNTIQFSSMLAHSMMIMDDGAARFAGTDFLSGYIGTEEFMMLYIGFLHQQNSKYYNIHFRVKPVDSDHSIELGLRSALAEFMCIYIEVDTTLQARQADIQFFKEIIMELGEKGEFVYDQATEIRRLNKLGEKIEPEIIHSFIESLLDMTEHATYACDTTINYLFSQLDLFKGVDTIKIDTSVFPEKFTTEKAKKNLTKYLPLDLKEKTASFISIARTCNDAWMDVVDKKYAVAILKLLEITTQLTPAENDLSLLTDIAHVTNQLDGNDGLSRNESWYIISNILINYKNGEKVKTNEKIKNAAKFVANELDQVLLYATIDTTKYKSVISDMLVVHRSVLGISTRDSWIAPKDTAELKSLTSLFNNPVFKELLLSYYGDWSIDKLSERIKNDLTKITVNGRQLFTSAQSDTLLAIFKNYIAKTYDYYVLNKQKERKKMNKTREEFKEELMDFTHDYLALFPTRFEKVLDPNVVKIIHLVNDLAVAKDGEDIEAIIEQFALPPGSSSIKRNAIFNVCLNAYPGIIAGVERTVVNGAPKCAFTASFTAPVGFSFAWGTRKGYSNGVFVPILDIGAITRFRFDNDSTSTILNDLRFQDVFAPGLYYSLGFKNTPLSLNIGAQYGPELRKIQPDGSATFFPSMRFGAALVVDIPLLNLATKPRL